MLSIEIICKTKSPLFGNRNHKAIQSESNHTLYNSTKIKMPRISTKAPAQKFETRPCVGGKLAHRPACQSVKWSKEERVTEKYQAVCNP